MVGAGNAAVIKSSHINPLLNPLGSPALLRAKAKILPAAQQHPTSTPLLGCLAASLPRLLAVLE